jgi:hypothetical protein
VTAVTPAQLRELAARAEALAAAVDAVQAALAEAVDEPARRAGFRLPDAAGSIRRAGRELEATAGDLARLRSRPAGTCPAEWGCCPEHGATLTSSAGECWCTAAGCGRRWSYDRLGLPCAEPVAFEVRGAGDTRWGPLCAGHTVTARRQIEGVEVRPVTAGEGDGAA